MIEHFQLIHRFPFSKHEINKPGAIELDERPRRMSKSHFFRKAPRPGNPTI
jgi:hypothetical protein